MLTHEVTALSITDDETVSANDMPVGTYAIICTEDNTAASYKYRGQVLLRTWGNWVVLSHPEATWSGGCKIPVKLLNRDSLIAINVQNNESEE